MDGLLRVAEAGGSVKSNTQRIDALSLNEGNQLKSPVPQSRRTILSIAPEDDDEPQSISIGLQPTIEIANGPNRRSKTQINNNSTFVSQQLTLPKSITVSSPGEAREILKSKPDHQSLLCALRYLEDGIHGKHDFNLHIPSPNAAQIINVLVTITVPDHWQTLQRRKLQKQEKKIKELTVCCLTSVAGIGALLLRIRQLIDSHDSQANDTPVQTTISVLASLLTTSNILSQFISDAFRFFQTETQRKVFWKEVTSLLAGSKILNIVSQTSLYSESTDAIKTSTYWISDGKQYSKWLARMISDTTMQLSLEDAERWDCVGQITKRGLMLGYQDVFVSKLYMPILSGGEISWPAFNGMLQCLSISERKNFYDLMLHDLVRRYLSYDHFQQNDEQSITKRNPVIGAIAAVLITLAEHDSMLEELAVHWLISSSEKYASLGLSIRRAIFASIASNEEKLRLVLEKSLEGFGDKLQIKHSPVLLQEASAQTVLLAIGYLSRSNLESVKSIAKSGQFLQMVSTRLAASLPRARYLGMIVAVAMSGIVDPPDKVMNFGVEEMETAEVQDWLKIIHIKDEVTRIEELKSIETSLVDEAAQLPKSKKKNPIKAGVNATTAIENHKTGVIEEIPESEGEEIEDLTPYPKPDDDPSDSEEDPTLIDRTKPTPPIYILDLIKQLQSTDKPEVTEIALKNAPTLIRRKAKFGRELSDNIYSVASSLINVQESMSKREMQRLRLESLIACLVSNPQSIGPWLASTYIEGDFSLVQRSCLLTTIGLGARELSGYKDDSKLGNHDKKSFPSQRLPSHLEAIYSPPIDTAIREIQHSTIHPMALKAADKITGPDALKIRTFSSRMEVEKRKVKKSEERSRRIPKDLHKILSESIYLPLCCRMSLIFSSTNVNNTNFNIYSRSTIFEPHLVSLYLQTLIILLSCLGPNASQLSSVTRETLLLLMGLHAVPQLSTDPVILPSLLQLLLTTLDLNIEASSTAEEQLITDFGPMIAELVTWANGLAGTVTIPVSTGDDMHGMPWPIIAAGIQVKWHEVGQKFQGRMFGLMNGDLDTF